MRRPVSGAFLFLLLFSLFLSVLYYNLTEQELRQHKHTLPEVPRRSLRILLWHWPFGRPYALHGDKCLQLYNISRCLLTDDTSALTAADVVVFHHQELSRGLSSLPAQSQRPAWQRWVWMSLEPPVNNANLSRFNGLFNWTMSYRRDADIHIPYGQTLSGGSKGRLRAAPNRSCLVSWVVSKYQPQQARAKVYESLKHHIPIQVYGKWKGKPLSNSRLLPTIAKCLFYLSFENSEAEDYISEKLWRNAFQAGVVPVVLGPSRATYEALAPPASFIHVADFQSTAELADFLRHVAAHRQAYQSYFLWQRSHRVKMFTDWRERLCQICVQYNRLPTSRVYHDLESWVYGLSQPDMK